MDVLELHDRDMQLYLSPYPTKDHDGWTLRLVDHDTTGFIFIAASSVTNLIDGEHKKVFPYIACRCDSLWVSRDENNHITFTTRQSIWIEWYFDWLGRFTIKVSDDDDVHGWFRLPPTSPKMVTFMNTLLGHRDKKVLSETARIFEALGKRSVG